MRERERTSNESLESIERGRRGGGVEGRGEVGRDVPGIDDFRDRWNFRPSN